MGDPILGRAYPALLAPGLRVAAGPHRGTVIERAEDALLVWWDGRPADDVTSESALDPTLLIDYADPHTRDRVCRALEARWGLDHGVVASGPESLVISWSHRDPSAYSAWRRPHHSRAHALRAVADAVWGEATEAAPEVP